MNLQDVIFLDLYQQIRMEWTCFVKEMGEKMLIYLEETTLDDETKEWFRKHLPAMIKEFETNKKEYDGREWSRDSEIGYDDLMERSWFDRAFYDRYKTFFW